MSKLAVVLFNLGGPDRLESMEPFLFNLFRDPAIIGAPNPVRWILAKWMSRRRAPIAREIYARIDGRSPLLELTRDQAAALEERLGSQDQAKVFVAMRYWHPMSDETAAEVAAFDPDEIILLPLYPQFSTTTTGSSLKDWKRAAAAAGLTAPTRAVCCYPVEPGFVGSMAELVREGIERISAAGPPRVLFSAHGLPRRVIERGDPYAWQAEKTARAIADSLKQPDLDWVLCYQSRVGPMEWIGPSIEDELKRAAGDRKPVVVAPIAFVSEHSETLVELDIKYRDMAQRLGVPDFVRVPTVGTMERFVAGLAGLVGKARAAAGDLYADGGGRPCPAVVGGCPNRGVHEPG